LEGQNITPKDVVNSLGRKTELQGPPREDDHESDENDECYEISRQFCLGLDADTVSLTLDAWTSLNGIAFLGVIGRWIDRTYHYHEE